MSYQLVDIDDIGPGDVILTIQGKWSIVKDIQVKKDGSTDVTSLPNHQVSSETNKTNYPPHAKINVWRGVPKQEALPSLPVAHESTMTLDEVEVLVITKNYWGRAKTLDAALQIAYNPKKYQVFICHRDTRVDDMGYVSYPKNFVPREILRKGLGRGKPFATFEARASPEKQVGFA